MNSHCPLLSIPPELRILIWSHVIKDVCCYVLENGSSLLNFGGSETCPDPAPYCNQSLLAHLERNYYAGGQFTALIRTCRQLHNELQPRLWRDTWLYFISCNAFISFTTDKLANYPFSRFSLTQLRDVYLNIGPAKYKGTITNASVCTALKMLVEHARNLKVLRLATNYYYEASCDAVLLNNKTLKCLLRFRDLSHIKLLMSSPPLGPLGYPEAASKFPKVLSRLKCLEEVLRRYLCTASAKEDTQNLNQSIRGGGVRLRRVKFELQQLIETAN